MNYVGRVQEYISKRTRQSGSTHPNITYTFTKIKKINTNTKNSIVIMNLPLSKSDKDLRTIFQPFGDIHSFTTTISTTITTAITTTTTAMKKAILIFVKEESVDLALQLNGHDVGFGLPLQVQRLVLPSNESSNDLLNESSNEKTALGGCKLLWMCRSCVVLNGGSELAEVCVNEEECNDGCPELLRANDWNRVQNTRWRYDTNQEPSKNKRELKNYAAWLLLRKVKSLKFAIF
jgi:RNA recognition motif-containing protein